jgi:hypothetical protein
MCSQCIRQLSEHSSAVIQYVAELFRSGLARRGDLRQAGLFPSFRKQTRQSLHRGPPLRDTCDPGPNINVPV